MCGLVAIDIQDISSDQIESVKKILVETEIRGRHASGISWFADKTVNTISAPKPISELVEDFDIYRCVDDNNGHLSMIVHIRYSTSDLEFNQPIHKDNLAIAHNGIISQAESDQWSDLFGLGNPVGKNDSELVHMAISQGHHPLTEFPDASMSVATLDKLGNVRVFRNGKRPLWISRLYNGFIATSTKDIIERSNVEVYSTEKTTPGVEYNLSVDSSRVIIKNMNDLQ